MNPAFPNASSMKKAHIGIDPGKPLHFVRSRVHNARMTYTMGPARIKGFDTRCEMKCAHCRADFIAVKDPRRKQQFCSRNCYYAARTGPANPNYRGGNITLNCATCGTPFSQPRNGTAARKTCSDACLSSLKKSFAKTTPEQRKIQRNVRRAILSYVRKKSKGGRKWCDLLGYGPAEVIRHLQALFRPGMTWRNYGRLWHVDHVRPFASFKFETPDDPGFKECWKLSNLQPLWAEENLRKGAR